MSCTTCDAIQRHIFLGAVCPHYVNSIRGTIVVRQPINNKVPAIVVRIARF